MPHAGTWIEIKMKTRSGEVSRSCLTQARGLKFLNLTLKDSFNTSCLTQARGLKSGPGRPALPVDDVVPHAGTWIEIINLLSR